MSTKLLDLEPQRRDALLNAALKEFAQRGFDHASTNAIAKEAGISKALMFHYASSKQCLFLTTFDYFADLLNMKYSNQLDLVAEDIFESLRQSYLLQLELTKQYPWIFEFNKLSATTNSKEVNKELEKRAKKKQPSYSDPIFKMIDKSRLRAGLDIEKCKHIILWANVGFTNQILNEIRNSEYSSLNYDLIVERIDNFIDSQKSIFYKV